MRRTSMWWCISSLALAGCPNSDLAPIEPCLVSVVNDSQAIESVDKVDLLFVVDDSGSMIDEQQSLQRELPRMVEALLTGHLDDDGEQDFPPVRDLHLGVVSTNMGALGSTSEGCQMPLDAVLLTNAQSCGALPGDLPFLAYQADPQSSDTQAQARNLGQQFGCMANLGSGGCGIEQQLSAALKALTPSTSPLRFSQGSVGHGDGVNAGFLRPDSVLAVILVTDEDDCSAPDESNGLWTPVDRDINVRCAEQPERAHPVSRYVDGLLALRPDNQEMVLFGALTGVPLALSGADPATILADPAMRIMRTTNENGSLVPAPACQREVDGGGGAAPARRIVETARLFGDQSVVHSICAADYRPALDSIVRKIGDLLDAACVPRQLERDRDGVVPCEVEETLQPGRTCDAELGRTPVGEDQGRAVCRVRQLSVMDQTVEQGAGWYYDDFSDQREMCAQRLAFTAGAVPTGVSIAFRCLQSIRSASPTARGREAVGMACPQPGCAGLGDDQHVLFCDAASQTCQIACNGTHECPRGWVCAAGADTEQARCVNPRCDP